MIVDCHTHIWTSKSQIGGAQDFLCLGGPESNNATPQLHLEAAGPADFTFVLGFVSNLLNAEISNDDIKAYIAEHPDRMIGFAGIDPTDQNCLENVRRFHEEPTFAGLTISPAGQGFHPSDTRAMKLY
ncbi:MAG: amidohydrolase family protein, partial [Planctomycetes bacterium]|nr:amidohydrolase family protein [Planctomycetota bacterium]